MENTSATMGSPMPAMKTSDHMGSDASAPMAPAAPSSGSGMTTPMPMGPTKTQGQIAAERANASAAAFAIGRQTREVYKVDISNRSWLFPAAIFLVGFGVGFAFGKSQ
eukprot:TRINITY_DN2932_c0_g1_i1.p2 TRINITY_DN2932_c0_g1~~TRINITY_DN2932_c0_g1_i1.p2  ORF type:complete len:108 (+),score=18.78 TRINITY_DN2932_c0_g1_i1:46-369(+)